MYQLLIFYLQCFAPFIQLFCKRYKFGISLTQLFHLFIDFFVGVDVASIPTILAQLLPQLSILLFQIYHLFFNLFTVSL